MRIGFFLENNKAGGLDTFVMNLLINWPNPKDKLFLFVNKDHPGKKNLYKSFKLKKNIKILLYKKNEFRTNFKSYFLNKLIKYINKIFTFSSKIKYIYYLLKSKNLERLFVIQGGFPGGIYGVAAIFSWSKISNKKPWLNFHNYPIVRNYLDIFWRVLERLLKNKVRGFISVSYDCIKSIKKRREYNTLSKRYIYNGLNHIKKNKKIKKIKKNKINLLMLAVYEERKGHAYLFEALKILKLKFEDFSCYIYGDGTYKEVKKIRRKLPPSIRKNVQFNGFKTNINSIVQKSDIMLVPSQEFESFGYSALEAMAYKKPVVSTDCGGLPEVIKNNKSGYVVSKKSPHKFANKLLLLIRNNKLRLQMGQEGYKRYIKYFLAKDMAKKYARIIRK